MAERPRRREEGWLGSLELLVGFVELEHIALDDWIGVDERQPTLVAFLHFGNFFFERSESCDLEIVFDDLSVASQTHTGILVSSSFVYCQSVGSHSFYGELILLPEGSLMSKKSFTVAFARTWMLR